MRPWIIWCNQRTGSISIFNALGTISGYASAESEPFDSSVEPRQFSSILDTPTKEWRRRLQSICRDGWLIKHVFDRLPVAFNVELATASCGAGYRHLHLVRADEGARLTSLGIAEQKALWFKANVTEQSIQDILSGRRKLGALPVAELLHRSREARESWHSIEPHLSPLLTVTTENLLSRCPAKRAATMKRTMSFLGLDPARLGEVERSFYKSGQDSSRLAHLVPNIEELRNAAT